MSVTLFKRFKMTFDLRRQLFECPEFPPGYELLPWREEILRTHADTKYHSFRDEMDSSVFACLGDPDGCHRLMLDITSRSGFIPEATWLVIFRRTNGSIESCGTIQGVQTEPATASIQNIGITRQHRKRKLGTILIYQALNGFQKLGLSRANLEVTALNSGAIRLYVRLGFKIEHVVYKTAEFDDHW